MLAAWRRGEYGGNHMIEQQPTDAEQEAIRSPRLIHGLMMAAGNGLRYFADRVNYELNPDDDAVAPARRPNYELDEWFGRLHEI